MSYWSELMLVDERVSYWIELMLVGKRVVFEVN